MKQGNEKIAQLFNDKIRKQKKTQVGDWEMGLKICSNSIAFHILLFNIYLFTTTNTQTIPPPKILKINVFLQKIRI